MKFKDYLNESPNKYKPGEFGYWWTIKLKKDDIKGQIYRGTINCSNKNLTSLKGCPKIIIEGSFYCYKNKLESLKYGPEKVRGGFWCNGNKLKSLDYAPKEIEKSFEFENNPELNKFSKKKKIFLELKNIKAKAYRFGWNGGKTYFYKEVQEFLKKQEKLKKVFGDFGV